LSNLDAQLRVHMRVEIRQLQNALGLTAVYVTHDQEEALAISDRIAVLRGGKIEQIGTPEAIYSTPETAFVGSFMGATNMLQGIVGPIDGASTRITVGGAEIRVPGRAGATGDRVLLSIRPETLRLVEGGATGPRLDARLTLREFLGPIQRLHAALPDGTVIRVALLGGQIVPTVPGDSLSLGYDPAQVIVYPAA
jgi:iron(III) transport system ATP-binding protein